MGHLYFARHGQTVWNVENKICGATDIALTETGHEQARELGRKILAEKLDIDESLCSPLIRAADTAREIAAITGLPLRVENALTEQCFGRFESTPRDGKEFAECKMHFADSYDGGESMLRLAQRIYNLLDKVTSEEGKVYLLVAHNGISRVIESYFRDMTNEEYARFGIGNCEIRRYDF